MAGQAEIGAGCLKDGEDSGEDVEDDGAVASCGFLSGVGFSHFIGRYSLAFRAFYPPIAQQNEVTAATAALPCRDGFIVVELRR